MPARENSFELDNLSGATVEMIREMVRRAEAKLLSLQSRRMYIRRRMQALHHLSRTVAVETAVAAMEDFAPETVHSLKAQTGKQSSVERNDRALESESSALRRACRIALMESDGAESCMQILQRICRRQSLAFKNDSDSVQEVTSELNRMVAEGEAIVFLAGDAHHWQLNRSRISTESLPAQRYSKA